VKEALKKETELRHLRRFQENLLAFPDGMVCVGEAPDFLVNTGHGYIDIEHTQWFRESNNPGGSRMRARESTQDKVLRLASSGYESRGLPPVWVNVLWSFRDLLTPSRIRQLANVLADLVEAHLPEQDGEVTIKHPHPAWSSLPPEVCCPHPRVHALHDIASSRKAARKDRTIVIVLCAGLKLYSRHNGPRRRLPTQGHSPASF
jgi:hypothetical protein